MNSMAAFPSLGNEADASDGKSSSASGQSDLSYLAGWNMAVHAAGASVGYSQSVKSCMLLTRDTLL